MDYEVTEIEMKQTFKECIKKWFSAAAIVAVGLFSGLLCVSCGDDSKEESVTIPSATVQLSNLESWAGVEPFTEDPAGDASDPDVDIQKVFFAHDNHFFYVRIDLVGIVDDGIDKEHRAAICFIDYVSGYELFFDVHINSNKVDLNRIGNEVHACNFPQLVMSYPGNEFLTWFDHTIVFKVRLSDIDFNLDRSQVIARVFNRNGNLPDIENVDSTEEKRISMDAGYLSSVTADWPVPSSSPPFSIPYTAIDIDGNITDWNGIEPIFTDRIDDVYDALASANIHKGYIAQDANTYYFRVDFLEAPDLAQLNSNPQVRFEFIDIENNQEYWFTAWLSPTEGSVWLQDLNLFSPDTPGSDIVKEYPMPGYLSVAGKHIEYRVLKADMGFDLQDDCMGATALNDSTDFIPLE